MTAAERLQAEKERLLTTTGFYVPPYRMANLMKAAAKIMDIIIKADTNICYEECRFIMATGRLRLSSASASGRSAKSSTAPALDLHESKSDIIRKGNRNGSLSL